MKKTVALVVLAALALLLPVAVVLSATTGAWIKYENNPVLTVGAPGTWDDAAVFSGNVLLDNGTYKMWYSGSGSIDIQANIGYATSTDGITWVKESRNPVLRHGTGAQWDSKGASAPSVLYDAGAGLWKMWYAGYNLFSGGYLIGYATSPDGITWQKYADNPVFVGSDEGWDDRNVLSPNVMYKDGFYHMWYAGRGDRLQIGYATSSDGINWTRHPENPVLQLGGDTEWDNGELAAPSVLFDGTEFHIWYQGFNRGTQRTYIGHATSLDGVHWDKDLWNPVLGPGPSTWDGFSVYYPSVNSIDGQLRMWYHGEESANSAKRIGFAGFDHSVIPTRLPEFPTPTPFESPTAGPSPTPTKPSGLYGLTINDGAKYTNQPAVVVSIRAPAGVPNMMMSNVGTFAGATWEPFVAEKAWNLDNSTIANPKKVYVRLADANQKILAGLQDSIILDNTPPEGSVAVLTSGFVAGAGDNYTLLLEGHDDLSGVAQMRLSNQSDFGDATWEPFVLTRSWVFDEHGIAYVQYQDGAGNLSAIMRGERALARAPGIYLPKVSK